jgi:hypothetical protein
MKPMNSKLLPVILAATALGANFCSATETKAQHDARMAWWREAKFGMFIHWGVYSVPAGYYNGKPVPGIGEWIMNRGKIPMAEYQAYAKEFNPTNFNAEQWVKIAKNAGQKYIVITSKHHDGFAMFDSKASDWNIVKATPFGRDPLKELAAACKKEGMVDSSRIYLYGYSMGGIVAMHTAALDPRVKGVVSICGFTPMRTDAADKGTGGLARYSVDLPLLPRLGFFIGQ